MPSQADQFNSDLAGNGSLADREYSRLLGKTGSPFGKSLRDLYILANEVPRLVLGRFSSVAPPPVVPTIASGAFTVLGTTHTLTAVPLNAAALASRNVTFVAAIPADVAVSGVTIGGVAASVTVTTGKLTKIVVATRTVGSVPTTVDIVMTLGVASNNIAYAVMNYDIYNDPDGFAESALNATNLTATATNVGVYPFHALMVTAADVGVGIDPSFDKGDNTTLIINSTTTRLAINQVRNINAGTGFTSKATWTGTPVDLAVLTFLGF